MPKPGPRRIYKYPDSFKATAVSLSQLPGVKVSDVADSLDIHPFMLSRWIKEVREGVIVAKGKKVDIDPQTERELKRLKQLEKDHKRLQMEHELLKKAIRFCSDQKRKSSTSSTRTGKSTRSK